MRVLNVSAYLDPVIGGGTAERTVQLSRAFSRFGWETTSLCVDTGFDREAQKARMGEARLEVLPCRNRRFLLPEPDTTRLNAMVEAVDIVHLCNHWTALNVLVVQAARRKRKPWVVCPAGALPVMGRSLAIKRLYNLVAGRSLVSDSAGWVAITRREVLSFQDYGVDTRQVRVIPNGIEPEEFHHADPDDFRQRHQLGEQPLLVFLGRLDPVKGPDLLLDAFIRIAARFPAWVLLFAGPDGGQLASLRATARTLGGRVQFLGHVPLQDKASLLKAASLVIVPSRSEAMSLVALEAGICATPVLMTTECGFDDLPDSGGGDLVAADAGAIAIGLEKMLGAADGLHDRGRKLRDYVLERYTWKASVLRYESLFKAILKKEVAA